MTFDDLERSAENLRRGVNGLQIFVEKFFGTDLYRDNRIEIAELYNLSKGYSDGFGAALAFAKEAAK